jgi:hypothetical protein
MISAVANAPNAATGAIILSNREARFSAGALHSITSASTGPDDGVLAKEPPILVGDLLALAHV